MLPESRGKSYQLLQTLLEKFQKNLLEEEFLQVKQIFGSRILPITVTDLAIAQQSRWQRLQTELHREFKLLCADWQFYNLAKKSITKEAKKQDLNQRINKMLFFTTELTVTVKEEKKEL